MYSYRVQASEEGGTPVDRTWRDPKRRHWLTGAALPIGPFLAAALVAVTGMGVFWWYGLVMLFVAVPLIDLALGRDLTNPPEEVVPALDADRYYRWCTYLFIPVQFTSLVFACWVWSSGRLSSFEALGLAMTVGLNAGFAINAAHELGHKHPVVEQWLSKVALAQSGYGHFFIEHNRGHHVHVATPEDPASARLGETLYEFLPRTVIGSLRSAVAIERNRRARAGTGFWSPRNDILNAWAMSVALFGLLIAVFGVAIAPWLALQAVVGFVFLEIVNYIEHYGLLRVMKENGRYERCQPQHSWNANQLASNLGMYQLQRHSDHHANPTRRYQSLREFEGVPQLPAGYPSMIALALVPPLWRRVMDRRLIDFYEGDVTRANIQPRRRNRLLEAHSSAGLPS